MQIIIIVSFILCILVFIYLLHIKNYQEQLIKEQQNQIQKNVDIDIIPKYLINLDKRTDRLTTTTQLLNQKGYNHIIRFPAIDGKKLSNDFINKIVNPESLTSIYKNERTEHNQLSRGAVGCYLSHTNVWNKINDCGIVFEDDTKPSLNKTTLNEILSNCPDDWDILLIGGIYNRKSDYINPLFDKVNDFLLLHAYIINKNGIDKIKPHLFPIQMQLDWVLSKLSQDEVLNIYAIKNSEWYQNIDVSNTDVQTPIKTG